METIENKKANSAVILIDDSAIDNFVNTKIITRYQFANDIFVFSKPLKALKYLTDLDINLIDEIPFMLFLDLDMPEMNGFEFLEAFSLLPDKLKNHIKIIILTSSCNPADNERCIKYNSVVAYFNKPLIKSNLDSLKLILAKNKQQVF